MRLSYAWRGLVVVALVAMSARAADLTLVVHDADQLLKADKYASVIAKLEPVLPQARGDTRVLALLRSAYRGESRRLIAAGNSGAAQKYIERLRLLEDVAPADDPPAESPTAGPKQRTTAHADSSVATPANAGWRSRRSDTTSLPAAVDAGASTAASPAARVVAVRSGGAPVATAKSVAPAPASARHLEGNEADAEQAEDWVKQADALFLATEYAEAAAMYDRAHRAAPSSVAPIKDRWAYCRLARVVDRINRRPTEREWATIKTEVQAILQLVPDHQYTVSLLRMADQHAGTLVAENRSGATIRATEPESDRAVARGSENLLATLASGIGLAKTDDAPRQSIWRRFRSGGWKVLETSNFRIHHNDDSLAGPIADVAEGTRFEVYRTWFGREPASNWQPKCDIFVHNTADSYVRATNQGPGSPGYSTTGADRGRIVSRRVDVRRDGPDVVTAILPHEITHVVMADRFNGRPLPRWADEGVAVLTEPAEKKIAHLRNLDGKNSRGGMFTARQLMTMADYPPGGQWGMFYAESVSLVDFLVAQRGPTQFIEFMASAVQNGYEAELKRVYGFANYDELDRAWSNDRIAQVAAATGR
jgi:hypothetical protein